MPEITAAQHVQAAERTDNAFFVSLVWTRRAYKRLLFQLDVDEHFRAHHADLVDDEPTPLQELFHNIQLLARVFAVAIALPTENWNAQRMVQGVAFQKGRP